MTLDVAKLTALTEQYAEQFPGEEPIEANGAMFGLNALQNILENRDGRKIVFRPVAGVPWKYEEEEEAF